MSLAVLIFGIAVFLLGAMVGAFAVFVIGIHINRGNRLINAPRTCAGVATYRVLIGVRNTDDQDERG